MQAITDFTPKADWQWTFDSESGQLAVLMGEHQISLAYKSRMLVSDVKFPLSFTLEDVISYNHLLESLPLASFSECLSHKIILHIIAIDLFHKPLMPQCWLFDIETEILDRINEGEIYSLKAKKTGESANYMLVEFSDDYVLCLLLDDEHNLSDRKSFQQFHVIKVKKDLLRPMWHAGQNNWTSYQIG